MKERHAQILEAIKSFYQENGFCPTVRQIGDMVGLKSTSTVITHLKAMEKAGLIIRNEFPPRSIIIPGFNDRKSENDNVFGKIETENTGFEPVFVLHGFWITGDDAGVDVFAVSPDPEYLRERMREEAEELLAGFQNSGTTFEVENIEETGTKYEVEGKYGDMVKLYITEHEVEGGEKSGKQYFIPENEKGC